jgi:hypothetical protein
MAAPHDRDKTPAWTAALLAFGGALAVGGEATAREVQEPPSLLATWMRPGLYLPIGVSAAGAYGSDDQSGLALGAEASLVSLGLVGPGGTWLGGYTDACWDFGADAFRHSAGPQLGIAMLGLDLGYLGEVRDGQYRPGFTARGLVTMGILSLFGRYGRLYGGAGRDDEDVAEFGVLAKFPLLLGGPSTLASEPEREASAVPTSPMVSTRSFDWAGTP